MTGRQLLFGMFVVLVVESIFSQVIGCERASLDACQKTAQAAIAAGKTPGVCIP